MIGCAVFQLKVAWEKALAAGGAGDASPARRENPNRRVTIPGVVYYVYPGAVSSQSEAQVHMDVPH